MIRLFLLAMPAVVAVLVTSSVAPASRAVIAGRVASRPVMLVESANVNASVAQSGLADTLPIRWRMRAASWTRSRPFRRLPRPCTTPCASPFSSRYFRPSELCCRLFSRQDSWWRPSSSSAASPRPCSPRWCHLASPQLAEVAMTWDRQRSFSDSERISRSCKQSPASQGHDPFRCSCFCDTWCALVLYYTAGCVTYIVTQSCLV